MIPRTEGSGTSGTVLVAPSILSADFAALGDAVRAVERYADLIHVDVMDGHFVPNLTVGPPVVKSLVSHTRLAIECHLMIDNPLDMMPAFFEVGASRCIVHVEAGGVELAVEQARRAGKGIGAAINPETPAAALAGIVDIVDLVLVMTVHPGFGGQAFMVEMLPKLAEVGEMACAAGRHRGREVLVEVDGGIAAGTAEACVRAGAGVLVAGSAVFHGSVSPGVAVRQLRKAAARA